jgi:hypothetical protein
MKRKTHGSWFHTATLAGLLGASATAQVVVYDNAEFPLNQFFASQREFGDEITIGPGWSANSFEFEYYADGLAADGSETAVVRFYRNDGIEVEGTDSSAPGGLIYESPAFPLINGNYPVQIVDLAPLNISLPESFTWTIKTRGVEGSEVFGLKVYDPPVVGSSFSDFWYFSTEGWELQTIAGVNANFAARLTAVPEPGALTIFGLGGLALFLRRRVRA